MIRNIEAAITRSKHYGATDADAYCLTLSVSFDSKEFSALRRKGLHPVRVNGPKIWAKLNEAMPWLKGPMILQNPKDWRRAKNGIKTIQAHIYLSKAEAERLGVDSKRYSIYHKLDLDAKLPHNVIQVNFKTKRKVG